MISAIQIANFKSIQELLLPLGRLNVLIGENGCGKTNILEAICFGGAAAANKLDREFLASRGIRINHPRLMRSGFAKDAETKPVELRFVWDEGIEGAIELQHSNRDFAKWRVHSEWRRAVDETEVGFLIDSGRSQIETRQLLSRTATPAGLAELTDFLIYSPQLGALRALERESFIEPLGIYGEGLFKLLKHLEGQGKLAAIKAELEAIEWFEDFEAVDSVAPGERELRIRDRYLSDGVQHFDHNSSNEGFLYLLFYACLLISEDTPRFFAVDNIESALNPKLCIRLIAMLTRLAKQYQKQIILTTHSPAILDGLDLADDEQRLFVVQRAQHGATHARRITGERWLQGEKTTRLSEAFLRGYLGGLPSNF